MRAFLTVGILLGSGLAFGNASGAIGYSGAPPNNQNCNQCHSGGGAPVVTFSGPTTLGAGATGQYTFTITGGAAAKAGMNVSVSDPSATLNPVSTSLGLAFGELCQKAPIGFPASFSFSMTAPPFAGTVKLYGTGNSTNGNGATSGDQSSSTSYTVTVTGGSGMNPPVIITAASAMTNPVLARSTQVSVTANDDGTEANLAYTWSSTGPAPVTFSPNGNNASKVSTASFSQAGSYMLTVTVRDGTNKTVTSAVAVTVTATYSVLRLTPVSAQVAGGGMLQYSASARDQFDGIISPQPTIMFQVPAGGGSINATGLLHAQSGTGGPFVVTANASPISTSATFAVNQAPPMPSDMVPPTVTLVAPTTPNTPLTDGLMFEATAFDNTGVASVTFEVATIPVGTVTSGPPWKVTYATNNTLPAGIQALEAVAKDIAGNETRSSSIPVDVPMSSGTGGGAGGGGGGTGTGGGGSPTDGGAGGGGTATDGGLKSPPPLQGCGCNTAPTAFALFALLALLPIRRRG